MSTLRPFKSLFKQHHSKGYKRTGQLINFWHFTDFFHHRLVLFFRSGIYEWLVSWNCFSEARVEIVKIAIPKKCENEAKIISRTIFYWKRRSDSKSHCSAIDLSHKFGRKSVFGKARLEFLKKILWQATSKDALVLFKLTFASSLPSCWIALAKKLIHVPSPTSCNKTIKLYESKQFFLVFLRFFHGRNFLLLRRLGIEETQQQQMVNANECCGAIWKFVLNQNLSSWLNVLNWIHFVK